jgi:hypothetical protein
MENMLPVRWIFVYTETRFVQSAFEESTCIEKCVYLLLRECVSRPVTQQRTSFYFWERNLGNMRRCLVMVICLTILMWISKK